MNIIVAFRILMGILLSITPGHSQNKYEYKNLEDKIVAYIKNGSTIGGMTPIAKGKIIEDFNHFVFVWKGKLGNAPIAIKFQKAARKTYHETEVKLLNKLKADANSGIRGTEFGIPKICYHGSISNDKYYVTGMTHVQKTVYDKYRDYTWRLNPVDLLLVFQKVLRAVKYMHANGVIHNQLNHYNFLLDDDQVFVGNFEWACVKSETYLTEGADYFLASVSFHKGQKTTELDDLQSLFYCMLNLAGVVMPWIYQTENNDIVVLNAKVPAVLEVKKNYKNLPDKIKEVNRDELKPVLLHCFKDVFSGNKLPNYEAINKQITDGIATLTKGKPAFFTWLFPAQKTIAGKRRSVPFEKIGVNLR